MITVTHDIKMALRAKKKSSRLLDEDRLDGIVRQALDGEAQDVYERQNEALEWHVLHGRYAVVVKWDVVDQQFTVVTQMHQKWDYQGHPEYRRVDSIEVDA